MKRALVLGGGGARGAYEMGVWQSLRENHIDYDFVIGVSIGALTGALIVQNRYREGLELWNNITPDQIIDKGVTLDLDLELLISQRDKLIPLLQKAIKEGGMDVSPLYGKITELADTKKIVNAKYPLYIYTVEVPNFTPHLINIQETKPEKMADYLMASASVFPAFPIKTIEDKKFIDGGYYDSLPIETAIKLGAEEVIAVNLKAPGMMQKVNNRQVKITMIEPYWSLGGFLNFTADQAKHNIKMGYLDAQKCFGKIDGFAYAFKGFDNYLKDLNKLLLNKIRQINKKKTKKLIPEISLVLSGTDDKLVRQINPDYKDHDLTLRLVEKLMELENYEATKIYNIRSIIKEINKKVKAETAINMSDWWDSFIKNPKDAIQEFEVKGFVINMAREFTKADSDLICLFHKFFPSECLMALLLNCFTEL